MIAYTLTAIAMEAYCSTLIDSNSNKLPHLAFWLLAAWATSTIILLALQTHPVVSGFGILDYAESHGWFVAIMFLWGTFLTLFFTGKVETPHEKIMWASYMPLLNVLVFLILVSNFEGILPRGGTAAYYFIGSIATSYLALVIAVMRASPIFRQRYRTDKESR